MRGSMVVVLGVVASAMGCGGGSGSGGGSLDCTYLASDNCWKTTAAMAMSCLPAATDVGTLSADGKTCTYASGQVVTFNTAVSVSTSTAGGQDNWNFSVTDPSGQPCMAYKNTQGGIVLTVQGQTVKEGASGELGLSLTCPDGTTRSNSNAFSLLSCPDAGLFGGLPGDSWSTAGTSVSLSLIGVASYDGMPVFNCQTSQ